MFFDKLCSVFTPAHSPAFYPGLTLSFFKYNLVKVFQFFQKRMLL